MKIAIAAAVAFLLLLIGFAVYGFTQEGAETARGQASCAAQGGELVYLKYEGNFCLIEGKMTRMPTDQDGLIGGEG